MNATSIEQSTISSRQRNICNRYWYNLQQYKFNEFFYVYHLKNSIKCSRRMRVGSSIATVLIMCVWTNFNNIGWVSSICLLGVTGLQLFNALSELLPYESRKNEIRELLNDYSKIYREMENEWYQIKDGQLTVNEIEDRFRYYEETIVAIEKHFFKNDTLPHKAKHIQIPEKETIEYFDRIL